MKLEIQVLVLDRHNNVAGLNRLMRSKPFFVCDNQSNNNKINKVMTFTYHLQSLLMSKTID
jgi:hypothetical protein